MEIKRTLLLMALLILAVACGKDDSEQVPCLPDNLEDHVIAFYPFTNGSLNDQSGNNQDLTNSTTAVPAPDRNGNVDCAYEFNNLPNSAEFLTRTNSAFLDNLTEMSVSLWYQPKNTSRAGGVFESLVSRDLGFSCPDRSGQWSVGLYDCRKAVFGRTNSVWDNNITNFDCVQELVARTDSWNHAVATFRENGVEMKIYRDGVLQDSTTGDSNCSSGTPLYADIGALFLGRDYTGVIDDVIIFDKVLTQADVASLFALETCCEE